MDIQVLQTSRISNPFNSKNEPSDPGDMGSDLRDSSNQELVSDFPYYDQQDATIQCPQNESASEKPNRKRYNNLQNKFILYVI